MKRISSIKPKPYFFHVQPKNPLKTLIRFCENVKQIESYWEYDEYALELPTTNDLEVNINTNYNFYLSQAKKNDKEIINKINEYISKEWITKEDINKYLNNDIEVIKKIKIAKSKDNLDKYLKSHPYQWVDNEYYSITKNKQNQLISTLLNAQIDNEKPEWNTTGGVCKQWDIEKLKALNLAIKNRVKVLVKYQQQKEIEINDCETLDELNSIVINYDEI